jgi:hypothetical protein
MYLQLVDQSLCHPEEILEDAIIRVGQSYVPIDFMVLETVEMKEHQSFWADLS